MCGIIGYTGPLDAGKIILSGLKQLEYRGYDSAGMALSLKNGDVYLKKQVGQVENLEQAAADAPEAHCGIGHTRWATHGNVTAENAHPHRSGDVILLHNGIIENHSAIQKQFGFTKTAVSQTDTETAAQLIDHYYQQSRDAGSSIRRAAEMLEGSYAFCILFADQPGKIYCIRNISPLAACQTDNGCFVASDVTALIPHSQRYFILPEHALLVLDGTRFYLLDTDGNAVIPEIQLVNWDVQAAQKNGYPHFMLKEIFEQPEAFARTIAPRINGDMPDFSQEGIPDDMLRSVNRIRIVACGTALYAGMVARSLLERHAKIPVEVSIASEFRYEPPPINQNTLVIVISQSGETIDTLAALRLAKSLGAVTIGIINVKGSTIARESDYVIYTHAGPEISVASTKAYMVQIGVLYLLAARFLFIRGVFTEDETHHFIRQLLHAENHIRFVLENCSDQIRYLAERISHCRDAFYIGRGMDYAFSLEGALKLKEITYIHAEAYAAGELKHGTISLIEDGVPVIVVATQDAVYSKTISNMREAKARGAYTVLISKEGNGAEDEHADVCLRIPKVDDRFAVFPLAVVLQLLAYYTAYAKGFDMDKPRNLAKSVTVE